MIGSPFRRPGSAQKIFAFLTFGAVTPILCQALAAQGPIDREIRFVRDLAREMRLIGLAQDQVQVLEQNYSAAADQDRIAQLKVEISLYAARLSGDRAEQRTAYKKALDESKELLERTRDEVVQRDAQRTLAEASQEFGQFLIEELEIARSDDPDRVAELEEEAGSVFRAGIEACDKVMAELESGKDKSDQNLLEYCLVWRRKGALLRENARAVRADRGHLIDKAKFELEDMVLEIGEETALGLRGLFEIAQCYEVAGKPDQAIDRYRTTIDQIVLTLEDDPPASFGALLFDMMQEVYAYLGEMLFERGEVEAAGQLFAKFREHLQKFGAKDADLLDIASPRFGHMTFLAECRYLAETGDAAKVQQALAQAQTINARHPNDYVGIRAKSVLNDILEAQQSLVSGALLFEVAKGEYQNQNFEEAIKGFRQAVAVMGKDEADELGLEAYEFIGRAYRQTDRWLEWAMALRRGLEQFGKKSDGTEHEKAAEVADSLDSAVSWLKNITKNDPNLTGFFESCEPLVLEYSEAGVGKIHWKNANTAFNESKYQEAVASYKQVPTDYVYYELAQIRAAKAQLSDGQIEPALETIAEYRRWLEADGAKLDTKRQDKVQVRELARREADYTEATIEYAKAYGDSKLGLDKDTSRYPSALEKLQAFVANHGASKDRSVAQALDAIGRLHTDLGELPQAEQAYMQLKELDESRASKLATAIFGAYLDHAENLARELDEATAQAKDKATTDRIRDDLRDARTRLCGLGMDYMRSAATPQLGILVHTMNTFESLQDWKRVDEVAKRALALYGESKDEETAKVIDMTVKPKIGEALLQEGKFQEALTMLEAAEEANPQQFEIKRLICRAKGGWFYLNRAGRGQKELALGQAKEAYDKFVREYRPWALRPGVAKYSLEWYQYHWQAYWYALQAGQSDTTYLDYAKSLRRTTIGLDQGAGLKALGEQGSQLFQFFELNRP